MRVGVGDDNKHTIILGQNSVKVGQDLMKIEQRMNSESLPPIGD